MADDVIVGIFLDADLPFGEVSVYWQIDHRWRLQRFSTTIENKENFLVSKQALKTEIVGQLL